MYKTILLSLVMTAMCLCPMTADTHVLPGYNGRFSEGYVLSPIDLYDTPPEELGLMRNEIFAKYGREFKTAKYRSYFTKKSWYRVNTAFKESFLDATDVVNVNLILSFERPALDAGAMKRTLLKNIEYVGDGYTVVFSDDSRLLMSNVSDFYSQDDDAVYSWSVRGDWVLAVKKDDRANNARVLLLLDHAKRSVDRMEIIDGK